MVYETKTLRLYHQLTKLGDEHWKKYLEILADEILWRHKHPIKAIIYDIIVFFKNIFD